MQNDGIFDWMLLFDEKKRKMQRREERDRRVQQEIEERIEKKRLQLLEQERQKEQILCLQSANNALTPEEDNAKESVSGGFFSRCMPSSLFSWLDSEKLCPLKGIFRSSLTLSLYIDWYKRACCCIHSYF